MWFTGLKISKLIPVWFIFLYIAYRIVKENKKNNYLIKRNNIKSAHDSLNQLGCKANLI